MVLGLLLDVFSTDIESGIGLKICLSSGFSVLPVLNVMKGFFYLFIFSFKTFLNLALFGE